MPVRREGTWICYTLGELEGGLRQRLAVYLAQEHEDKPVVAADLERLQQLADRGQICAPRGGRSGRGAELSDETGTFSLYG